MLLYLILFTLSFSLAAFLRDHDFLNDLPALHAAKGSKKQVANLNASERDVISTKDVAYAPNVPGVLTFRGDFHRTAPSYGTATVTTKTFEKLWSFRTGKLSWGGGAGWTGQPAIIQWPADVRQIMNIKEEFKSKADFTEVVYASLDGKVYFFELESGAQTRTPIDIKNPIKGSVSLDPRGYPILYVGQGINETGEFKYRFFNLIDGQLLYSLEGIDPESKRGRWGAFDGSALIDGENDRFLIGGENGIFYNVKLNSQFDAGQRIMRVNPSVEKYIFKTTHQGIENSIAKFGNLAYFSDNGGLIQAVDLNTMQPVWTFQGNDDTDATLTIDVEDGKPFLYTGNEVDKQGVDGLVYLRKIDGMTGRVVWEKRYKCFYSGGKKPVNGGLLATPVVGKNEIADRVIFTLARYGTIAGGYMVALDKKTGNEWWTLPMKQYSWSSPIDFLDQNGQTWIMQADHSGQLHWIDPRSGLNLYQVRGRDHIEASPAMFNGIAVLATRGGEMFAVKMK